MSRWFLAACLAALLMAHAVIRGQTAADSTLEDRLIAAAAAADRDRLLDENASSITADLYRRLLARARADADKQQNVKAAPEYDAALAVARRLGDPREIGVSYRGAGLMQYRLGHIPEALDLYQRGVSFSEQAGDKATLAELLRGIGVSQRQQGHLQESLASTERSIALSREIGDTRSAVGMLGNLAIVYGDIGELRKRDELLREGLRLAEENHFDDLVRSMYENLAISYIGQGDDGVAVEYLEKNLRRVDPAHVDKRGLAATLSNLAIVYRRLGRYDEALDAYRRAVALYRDTADERGIAITLLNLSALHRIRKDFPAALAEIQESVAIWDRIDLLQGRAAALNNLAYLQYDMTDFAAAEQTARTAIDLARAFGDPGPLLLALQPLGRTLLRAGRLGDARTVFAEAIALTERFHRNMTGGGAEGRSFLKEYVLPYHALVLLNLDEGRTRDALAVAEQAKARQLYDVIHSSRGEVTKAMSGDEKDAERRLASEVSRLNVELARGGQNASVRTAWDRAVQQLEALRADLYGRHPELRVQRADVQPPSDADLSAIVSDASTAILDYTVTADDDVVGFVIARDGDGPPTISAKRIKWSRAEVERDVEAFRLMLAARDFTYRRPAAALYRRLIAPFADRLRGRTLVAIVPDSALWDLPFQALVAPDGRHFIEDHAVFYTPSITSLAATSRRTPDRDTAPTLLAVGAPDAATAGMRLPPLPQAARETRALGLLYGKDRSTVLTGRDAREDRWKTDAARYRVLHLATHGVLNSANPLYSFVVLGKGGEGSSDDGLLEGREILDLDLHADLVVLSACETARGRFTYGEGSIGMSWAFLVAGTPTTVVSEWKVTAGSTSQFMLAFHRRLLTAKAGALHDKARALQHAAVTLARTTTFQHPFYWAAFTMIGDGR